MPIPGQRSWPPSVAAREKILAWTLKKVISRAHCATWATSPIACAAVFSLIRQRRKIFGDSEASAFLTRDYRKPFVVPAIG